MIDMNGDWKKKTLEVAKYHFMNKVIELWIQCQNGWKY